MEFDFLNQTVKIASKLIPLTRYELTLLNKLYDSPKFPVSINFLKSTIGYESSDSNNIISVYIHRLRKILPKQYSIKTIKGNGYKLISKIC